MPRCRPVILLCLAMPAALLAQTSDDQAAIRKTVDKSAVMATVPLST